MGLEGAGVLLWLCASTACAGPLVPVKPMEEGGGLEAEVRTLRQALADRDRNLNELESRLALLEAEQRQLRYALSDAEAKPEEPREVAVIRDRGGRSERKHAAKGDAVATLEPLSEHKGSEYRPVLRLFGDRQPFEAGSLPPVPLVYERLPIAPVPALGAATASAALPADAASHYRQAIDLVQKREFEAALAALTDFLIRYPSDVRAPRVMFWRGEVLFVQRDFARALTAFESALAREPSGDRAADALLKVGLCHKRLGAPERARAAIERLKAQFPQSDAARLAAQEDA